MGRSNEGRLPINNENDVLDIVTKLEGKSVVSSKWIYEIKYAVNGSIEKYNSRFVLEDSLKKREFIMKRHLHQ